LGSEHPDVADGQFAFARFYLGQQNFIRAQQYYQQTIATWEKTLGLDHPLVLNSVDQYQLMSKQLIDDLKSSPSN
jgi:Tetratricopeptide repeat